MSSTDVAALWDMLVGTIEEAIVNTPRSLQRRIGPSEIGTPCDRCLGHKLAQTEKREQAAWLPTIGQAVHAWLEEVFRSTVHLPEERVCVGEIDGIPVDGTSDLYVGDPFFTVVDWKIVGDTTIKDARFNGVSEVYNVQRQAYGRGWRSAGYRVDGVAIAYLPRNAASLRRGFLDWAPYDETVVTHALARAEGIAIAGRLQGWDAVLPKLSRRPGCYDCSRYPALPSDSKPGLDDVIAIH